MGDLHFTGRVALVTGGGAGIGAAVAHRFAALGASVVVNDIDGDAAAMCVSSIQERGGVASATVGDVGEEEYVVRAVAEVVAEHGGVDVLVAGAGISVSGAAADYQSWRRVLAVNLDGPYFWSREAARQSMIARGSGSIVLLSSNAGLAGYPGNVGYIASKHGVIGLTKALAVEWARHGIRVNCVCPGFTETPMIASLRADQPLRFADREARIPLGRAAAEQERAEVVTFLVSPAASYVTGSIVVSDGGQAALYSGYTGPL